MSRLDSAKRLARATITNNILMPPTVKELNSTGKKNLKVSSGAGVIPRTVGPQRDLSMPRLNFGKEKPVDEYVPNAVPRIQQPLSHKQLVGGGAPVHELNMRL